MANLNNLEILLDNGSRLDYISAESLGIKLNRIVDDFQNPSKRFGEFSYTFTLPRTKNNDTVFEYPDVKGRTRIFVGKSFGCTIYNNKKILLEGLIELTGINIDSYSCQFYSSFTQLIDDIGSKDVSELTVAEYFPINYQTQEYENIVANHINAEYANSDETAIQFPFIFYRTQFIPNPTTNPRQWIDYASTNLTFLQNNFRDFPYSKIWYFYHQFPPAFYLVSIMNALFKEVGWNVNGSWINDSNIKKIIIPYVGDSYRLINNENIPTDSTFDFLIDFNKFLPKIKCIDFLKSVINTFNLYFKIDAKNKTITLETYPILFGSDTNVYNVNNKIEYNTVEKEYNNINTQILFTPDDNNKAYNLNNYSIAPHFYYESMASIYGDIYNVFFGDNGSPEFNSFIIKNFNNKLSGEKEIKVNFSEPSMIRMALLNKTDINGNTYSGFSSLVYINIPAITKQTLSNNQGYFYSATTGETFSDNSPSTMQFSGGLNLMYYYGLTKYNSPPISVPTDPNYTDSYTGLFNNWAYINMATGGTSTVPTGVSVRIPYASPYRLPTLLQKEILEETINSFVITETPETIFNSEVTSIKAMDIHASLMTYYMAGNLSGNYESTDYHLTFGDDDDLINNTLYSTFHKEKYSSIENGYILSAKMRMDENDWDAMQIDTTILFNGELFRLVSIKNYDPIGRTADIELLKKS